MYSAFWGTTRRRVLMVRMTRDWSCLETAHWPFLARPDVSPQIRRAAGVDEDRIRHFPRHQRQVHLSDEGQFRWAEWWRVRSHLTGRICDRDARIGGRRGRKDQHEEVANEARHPRVRPPRPPKRARAAPARALLRVAHALAPRRCRSADLNTEEGRLQFAAYVRGAIHGRTCDASKSPSFIMDIESLGLDGRSYKELVRSCADACIITRWRVFVHLGFR